MSEADRSPGDVAIREVVDDDLAVFYEHQRDPVALKMAAFPARDRPEFMAHWAKNRANPTAINRSIVVDDRVVGYVVWCAWLLAVAAVLFVRTSRSRAVTASAASA